jgi:hypothetical protein
MESSQVAIHVVSELNGECYVGHDVLSAQGESGRRAAF